MTDKYDSVIKGFRFVILYSRFVYDYAYTKISGYIPGSIIDSIQGEDWIDYIEPDGVVAGS